MTSVQKYLQIVHDRSVPKWVISLMCQITDLDVCEASAGISMIQEFLDLKLYEQRDLILFRIEGGLDKAEGAHHG